MVGPKVDPVVTDDKPPRRVDVVIVGGGIIGSSAAFYLAKAGVSVALCEKGHIGGEQSSRNWGWCRTTMRDPLEIPLSIEALRLWRGLDAEIEADTGFREAGILFAGESDEKLAQLEDWLDHARSYQIGTRMIAGAELEALLPGATKRVKGGLYAAKDGRAEPQKAVSAIAQAARRLGASVLTGCAVRGLETAAGRVAGVVTEKGAIACNTVILAGGAWSRLFCDGLDLRLPQLKVIATVMRTSPLKMPIEHALWTSKFAFRKRLDGGYTIANSSMIVSEIRPESFRFFTDFLPILSMDWRSVRLRFGRAFFEDLMTPKHPALDKPTIYERVRVLDPAPAEDTNRRTKKALEAVFPAFKAARIEQQWGGSIDVTPDALPAISPIDAVPGFFVATGFSGHGFGVGPAAGHLAADLVTGATPIVDPTPFRFSRFSDGSKLRPFAGP